MQPQYTQAGTIFSDVFMVGFLNTIRVPQIKKTANKSLQVVQLILQMF